MRAVYEPSRSRSGLPDPAAGHSAAFRAARRIPRHAAQRALSPPRRSGRAWMCRGTSLSCVIIDKLPFAVPSDPVVEARIAAVRESGGESFLRLPDPAGRPRAQAGLRAADPQQTDRGVLSILDNRITKMRYGQLFFDSLPDYAFTMDIADVAKFFESMIEGMTMFDSQHRTQVFRRPLAAQLPRPLREHSRPQLEGGGGNRGRANSIQRACWSIFRC